MAGLLPKEMRGGLFVENSILLMQDSTLTQNEAYFRGGALQTLESDVTLIRVTISENTALYSGGGLQFAASIICITESHIAHNRLVATGSGSPRFVNGALRLVEKDGTGGGIHVSQQSRIELGNVSMCDNDALYAGGGMYLDSESNAELRQVLADPLPEASREPPQAAPPESVPSAAKGSWVRALRNTAGLHGGALSMLLATCQLTDVRFEENEAALGSGGSIHCATGYISGAGEMRFGRNRGMDGGALSLTACTFEVLRSVPVFSTNFARQQGGAVTVFEKGTLDFRKGGVFEHNRCGSAGGVLHIRSLGNVLMDAAAFHNNTAGAGAVAYTEGSLMLSHSNLTENVAAGDAGGVYVRLTETTPADTVVNLTGVHFEGNAARSAGNGGALYAVDWSGQGALHRLYVRDVAFVHNEAEGGGGAVFSNGNFVCERCGFAGNAAAYGNDTAMPPATLTVINSTGNISSASGLTLPLMRVEARDGYGNLAATMASRALLSSNTLRITAGQGFFERGVVEFDSVQLYATPGTRHRMQLEVLELQAASAAGAALSLEFEVHLRACAPDEYEDANGVCQRCSEDMYLGGSANGTCIYCGTGQVALRDASGVQCRACPPGTFQTSTELDGRTCQLCPPGTFQTEPGKIACLPCEKGEFSNASGRATRCNQCAKGSFQNVSGSVQCTLCPRGFHADREGQPLCRKCELNSYASLPGMTDCVKCPTYTGHHLASTAQIVAFVATKPEECYPNIGYYGVPGESPLPCPAGGVCCQCPAGSFASLEQGLDRLKQYDAVQYSDYCDCKRGTSPYPYPASGYVRAEGKGFEHRFLACPNEGSCKGALTVYAAAEAFLLHEGAGGNASSSTAVEMWTDSATLLTLGHCAEGYTGRLCRSCAEGFYQMSGFCMECPATYRGKVLLTVGGGLAVIGMWVLLGVYLASMYASLSVVLLYMQVGSMLQGIDLNWPSSVEYWALAQQIVNFDVDFVSPQCIITTYSFHWSYYVQMSLPLFVLLLNGLLHLVGRLRIGQESKLDSAGKVQAIAKLRNERVASVLSFQEIVYHSLCIRCFQPWVCSTGGDGLEYLMAAPDTECWEGKHIPMLVVSGLALALYVVGIPFLFYGAVLAYGLKNNALKERSFSATYGWLYNKYELSWMWWSMVILARRLLCAAILVFFQRQPFLQAVLALSVLVVAIMAHYFARPFVDVFVDITDSISLCSLLSIVVFGMMFYTEDLHDISSERILVPFFLGVAAPICFGCLAVCADVYNNHVASQAIQKLLKNYTGDIAKYDNRFHLVAVHLHNLAELTKETNPAGVMSEDDFVHELRGLDDGIHPELKPSHACHMYQQAAKLHATLYRYPIGTEADGKTKTGAAGDCPMESGKEALSEARSEPTIHLLSLSVALQYIEALLRDAVISSKSMCWEKSSTSNNALSSGDDAFSLQEMRRLWSMNMPTLLTDEEKEVLLGFVFPQCAAYRGKGDDGIEKMDDALLEQLCIGKVTIADMLQTTVVFVEQQAQIIGLIQKCFSALVDCGSEEGDAAVAAVAEEIVSPPTVSFRRTFSRATLMRQAGTLVNHTMNTVVSRFDSLVVGSKLSQDKHAMGMDACKSLLDTLDPRGLTQDWVHNHQQALLIPIFYELGNYINVLHHLTAHDQVVHLYNTGFMSVLLHGLCDSFPFIFDWMVGASTEELEVMARFLQSLCEYRQNAPFKETKEYSKIFPKVNLAPICNMLLQTRSRGESQALRVLCESLMEHSFTSAKVLQKLTSFPKETLKRISSSKNTSFQNLPEHAWDADRISGERMWQSAFVPHG
ncbi:hypothetical protein CYMTET_12069 [Cymbomonas tetramitiformis]|uniref:Tyrosine-protein kinase ephrin type A/B receptor-like domain-containing protein n=1 Tax=Cymbomonas tetramitiformis TaxID=36881 RepID=A0AAE0GLE2_9CHLO|nr:hypothetical protein CYMTET_12069 [Cymbomonas tetramitiformis]